MLYLSDLIIPFDWEEREQFLRLNTGRYPKRVVELVTGIKLTMPARKIKRTVKPDTRYNSGVILPEPDREKIVAVKVANGTIVLTTPDRADKIKKKYLYLSEF